MKGFRTAAAFLMAVLTLFGCVPLFSIGVNAGAQESAKELDALFDYSVAGREYAQKDVGAFLAEVAGIALTQAEKDYFNASDVAFRYSDGLPADLVTVEKRADGFGITAKEYEETAKNGAKVRWTPVSVTANGRTEVFRAGNYTASFDWAAEQGICNADVLYETAITFPAANLTALANAGYAEGSRLVALRAEYDNACADYERERTAYESAYAQYLIARNEYNEYLRLLSAYNEEKAAYDRYLAARAEYERDLEARARYLAEKEAYDEALTAYEQAFSDYQAAVSAMADDLAAIEACRASMEVFDTVFVLGTEGQSDGHMLFYTLKGTIVSSVVNNKERLINEGGVSREDVENAGSATNRLIELFNGYMIVAGENPSFVEDSKYVNHNYNVYSKNKDKTEKARFEYYKEHYAEFKDQFILLFSSLYSLCQNGVVRSQMQKHDRLQRFYEFISQLYVISTGMDDATTFSPDWTIRNKKPEQFLEAAQMPTDRNNADPSALVYPEQTANVPEEPEKPTPPEYVAEPQKTWTEELAEPTAPTAVSEPVKPTEPTAEKPVAPAATAEQLALESAVKAGALKERTVAGDRRLTLNAHIVRKASALGKATAAFYDYDRKTLLYEITVSQGSTFSYGGEQPARQSDERYTYTFTGWVTGDGKPATFGALTEDRVFYASYRVEEIRYTVTFSLHGEEIVKTYSYGELPDPGKTVPSYTENGYIYEFTSFTPGIALVTGNAKYTANYRKNDGTYYVTFIVRGNRSEFSLTTGQTPVPPEAEENYIEKDRYYTFIGWTPEITAATKDAEYTAVYQSKILAPFDEQSGAEITESAGAYSADCTGRDRVDIGLLAQLAKSGGKGLIFTFDRVTLRFDAAQTVRIAPASGEKRFLDVKREGDRLTVALTNGEDAPAAPKDGVQAALLLEGFKTDGAAILRETEKGEEDVRFTVENGEVALTLTGRDVLRFALRYDVALTQEGPGRLRADVSTAEPGQTVSVTATPDDGGRLTALYLIVDGERTALTEKTFEMPAGDVTVHAVFEAILYTVTFLDANGNVISQKRYAYNETPELPADPVKEGNDEVLYTFLRWDPVVRNVTEDVEYRPVFKEGANGKNAYLSEYNSNMFFVKVLLPLIVVFLLISAGAAVLIVLLVKKSKKRKKL